MCFYERSLNLSRHSDERIASPLESYESYNKPALSSNVLDNGAPLSTNTMAGKPSPLVEPAVTNTAATSNSGATMTVIQASDSSGGLPLALVASGSGGGGGGGGVSASNVQEVDEDGYSIQPPKEAILEANGDKDGK